MVNKELFEFLDSHLSFINWEELSKIPLPENIIIHYFDKLHIKNNLEQYQKLSEDIIHKFSHIINWKIVSRYQYLSESMICEFSDKINWYDLCNNDKIYFTDFLLLKFKVGSRKNFVNINIPKVKVKQLKEINIETVSPDFKHIDLRNKENENGIK